MALLPLAIAGAALGAIKSERARAEAERNRKLAAQLMMTTPYGNAWKALAEQYAAAGMQNPDDLSAIAEGALGGASLGQMFQKGDAQNKLYSSLGNYFDSQSANKKVDDMISSMPSSEDFIINPSSPYSLLRKRRINIGGGV